MVEKVKNLNWNLYSKVFIILANVSMIFVVIQIALNTKKMDNGQILIYYIIIGFTSLLLMKLSNAIIKELNE